MPDNNIHQMPPRNINVSLEQTMEVSCNECQCKDFVQVLRLRKASGLLTGQDKPSYIPIPVFACNACGHVNQEFLPQEIKSLD